MMTPVFRNQPQKLSHQEMMKMVVRNKFFDNVENISAPGFSNQFESKNINNYKVIIDHASGLMWQRGGSSSSMDYKFAQKCVIMLNKKNYAGFSNWRIPTLEEAMSLMEQTRKNDDLYIDPLFDSKQSWIWTCDQGNDDSLIWMVSYGSGQCDVDNVNDFNYIRAVRIIEN